MIEPKNEWDRQQLRRYQEARRRVELFDAARAALRGDTGALEMILGKWEGDDKYDRDYIARYEKEQQDLVDAARAAEEAKEAAKTYDGPPINCEVRVGREMGRLTQFGRCLKPAKYTVTAMERWTANEIVLNVCTVHRNQAAKGHGLERYRAQ